MAHVRLHNVSKSFGGHPALKDFNLVRTNGLAPTTAALAVTMQLISFLAVIVFFRIFGTRHFKGTYIL